MRLSSTATTTTSTGATSSNETKKSSQKTPKVLGKAKSIGASAIRRIKAHLDLKARLANHREAQADSITALSHANDSTEFVHRHFERSRIDKLGGCGPMGAAYGRGLKTLGSYSTGGSEEEFLGDEVRGQIGLWAATGRFWVKGTYREGPRVRFLHEDS